ncbi:MAG: phosphatidylglycerophosphatase A [Candidatus Schekmanbacteria bacterium]|nr:MAG: phosphatidylglycerophosphatase A [Candidatus Schekmanbacteria bacterium]
MKKLIILFVSFFYLGYAPIVPGTFGSLGGLAIYYFIDDLSPFFFIAIVSVLFVAGSIAATKAEEYYGRKDSSEIVIDEVVGMLITLFLIPFSLKNLIVGFVVFRIMDIIKPFPGRAVERIKGGTGVMLDDVVAGIYGNILMQVFIRYI